MNKFISFTLISLFCLGLSYGLQAQTEFKIAPKSASKIKLKDIAGDVTVESYMGNELVILAPNFNRPAAAEGLNIITTRGTDNTGIGLSAQEAEGTLLISGVSKDDGIKYLIQVPQAMSLSLEFSSHWYDGDLIIKNFNTEIEGSVGHNDVFIENVSGPIVLKNTHGDMKVVFGQVNQDKPCSIISAHGDIDVSLPENTPANLKLESSYGDIYTNFNIAYNQPEELSKKSKGNIQGKINGGGVEMFIKSPYENIYLRKK